VDGIDAKIEDLLGMSGPRFRAATPMGSLGIAAIQGRHAVLTDQARVDGRLALEPKGNEPVEPGFAPRTLVLDLDRATDPDPVLGLEENV